MLHQQAVHEDVAATHTAQEDTVNAIVEEWNKAERKDFVQNNY